MAKNLDNLDSVWEELESGFNPHGEEGLVGIAYGIADKGPWEGHVVAEFGNLSRKGPLNLDEVARCQGFIKMVSEKRRFRSKKVPSRDPNFLGYVLRP